jgi:predicted nucleic acid-binding protein
VYHPPIPLEVATSDLRKILASPSLIMLRETRRHFEVLDALLSRSGVTGNLIHDAHIAALCLEHGVEELISGDADFARFKDLRVRDPFRA